MLYRAKFAVCSEILTKHTNSLRSPYRIFERYTWSYVKLSVDFEMLIKIRPMKAKFSSRAQRDMKRLRVTFERKEKKKNNNNKTRSVYDCTVEDVE